ncbi:MAG: enolase C-terminal domain-like protein, partial [Caulobacteraceae bacterium]
MSKISSVEARLVRVPLSRPTSFSNRTILAREYALVRVRSEDGGEGIGFCYAGHAGGSLSALAVRELFAPAILGSEAWANEELWDRLYRECLLHGRGGSVMRALSALDIALWDLNARAANLPLWSLLGATSGRLVPAYASGGYYLDGKGPDGLAREVAGYVDQGFTAVKNKVGRGDLLSEEARIAVARQAIGPEILLMLDANNAWRDVAT